jgi:hypothetical protein
VVVFGHTLTISRQGQNLRIFEGQQRKMNHSLRTHERQSAFLYRPIWLCRLKESNGSVSGSEYDVGQTTIILEEEGLRRSFEVECKVDAPPLSSILEDMEVQGAR